MSKLWAGRTDGATDQTADDFNSSLPVDCRMYEQDIRGSMAHAAMLGATSIISQSDADTIISTLSDILSDIKAGILTFDEGEDIHMWVEAELTARI